MSDSSSLTASLPSDFTLEKALRDAVRHVYQTGNLEDLTVKRVRKAAEEQLDLEKDYFKNDPSWKEKSKSIIRLEVEAHAEPASSQISPQKNVSPKISKQKRKPQPNGKRRVSTDSGANKRQKKEANSEKPISSQEEQESKPPAGQTDNPESVSPVPLVKASEGGDVDKSSSKGARSSNATRVEGSGSEMSEVLDEAPKPRRKRKSAKAEKGIPKKAKTARPARPEEATDPDTEDIKRLQGWLTKCGIRKMWWKELQPYDTSKSKIRHLKELLAEAGMTGSRYSAEKAAQIKEERELKADLEAVQAGDKQWGMGEAKEEDEIKPKRRLAKGLKELDFLNDDDGEETD